MDGLMDEWMDGQLFVPDLRLRTVTVVKNETSLWKANFGESGS